MQKKKKMVFRVAYNIDDDINTFPYVGEVVLKVGNSSRSTENTGAFNLSIRELGSAPAS